MIKTGDCLEIMKKMQDNYVSCIVTDPPYGLGFMGKKWDAGLPQLEIWKEVLRISKPGTFLLSFGGTRTYHRLTCAIEDAGWEIRDCLQWIYGSGFPKSHNNFGLKGYGTALKPAYEPIIMAMKPLDGTFAQNAEKWGQAGINIDTSRIPHNDPIKTTKRECEKSNGRSLGKYESAGVMASASPKGRWPANVILDEEAGKLLDEQSGKLKSGKHSGFLGGESLNQVYGKRAAKNINSFKPNSGGTSRFFYCAKASSIERNEGLDRIPLKDIGGCYGKFEGDGRGRQTEHQPAKNKHPTVKPLKLMEYLIKLVMPPKDGLLLDPFCGSGTTLLAAKKLGFNAIGIEKCEEYVEIAKARLNHFEETKSSIQLDMFG